MAKTCKKCGINNDIHRMIHKTDIKDNLCVVCAKPTMEQMQLEYSHYADIAQALGCTIQEACDRVNG